MNRWSKVFWLSIDGDHRSASRRMNHQRIISVHAIAEDGPVMAKQWSGGKALRKQKGGFVWEDGKCGSRKGKDRSRFCGSEGWRGIEGVKGVRSQGVHGAARVRAGLGWALGVTGVT